ncbi:MAG: hypothetical protein PVJ80_01545 [Gemmatimonadota bacterium]|jgi:hypothetical protein
MSENDEVKPFHAKDVASGQEAADAVAAVLKHAHERDEAAKEKRAPKKQPKWMLPLGINLGVFAAYLLIWAPDWVIINEIAPPPVAEQVESTQRGMFAVASRIEGYRQENGSLPASVVEALGREAPGYEYTVQGNDYVLITQVGDEIISFNSAVQSLSEWGEQNAAGFSTRIGG